jgi:hypothetical protein
LAEAARQLKQEIDAELVAEDIISDFAPDGSSAMADDIIENRIGRAFDAQTVDGDNAEILDNASENDRLELLEKLHLIELKNAHKSDVKTNGDSFEKASESSMPDDLTKKLFGIIKSSPNVYNASDLDLLAQTLECDSTALLDILTDLEMDNRITRTPDGSFT